MSQHHILLVEDDLSLLDGMSDLLQLEGYRVSVATDGRAALEHLEAMPTPPDLIVSDIRMPNMDGYQFLDAVRERQDWLRIPFVFLTAKGEKGDVRYGKLQGADDYLTKPFEFDDLLTAVKAKISRHAELETAQEARIEDLKARILAALNHEFRTPLNLIVAYADLMSHSMTGDESEDMQDFLEGILEGGERLHQLVENFLTLADMESGYAARRYERYKERIPDIAVLIQEVVETARSQASAKGVTVELTSDPDLPAIEGNREYLRIAVRHLVENAIKFSPEGQQARVLVRVQQDGAHLCIVVRDQGRGIPEAERQRLFEAFHQFEREKYEQRGIGAGLATVRHVARLHGGDVKMETEPGQGSCFTLCLPIA